MSEVPRRRLLRGIGVSGGRGAGTVVCVTDAWTEPPAELAPAGDPQAEIEHALAALEHVAADLEMRGERVGGEARDVLAAQAMMARDPSLADEVRRRVADGAAAARAVFDAFGKFRSALAAAGEYVAARVADLDDVRNRTVAHLLGVAPPRVPVLTVPSVVVGRDLAPADTALLDPALVVGLVTQEGGPTSHTAILARALGVPAVVACAGALDIPAGVVALVDGSTGEVELDPARTVATAPADPAPARDTPAAALRGPGQLADGTPVPLLANVGGAADARAARAVGAQGIGLFRTEIAFLHLDTAPTEDEQADLYAAVLDGFRRLPVVARVLDAGADKPLAFLPHRAEPNPALGMRGIRALLAHPELLDTQLRALVRAARTSAADLAVMAPMVGDAADARAFVRACRTAGFAGSVGAMIEVPAAAVRARDVLREVDFVSIGTNDLAQYLFAAERASGQLARLQDPWQPALLDLVAVTAEAARSEDKPCGVCGEAAADPVLACVLVGLGVTSLSATAAMLPAVGSALAAHDLAHCRRAADAARAASDASTARGAALAHLPGLRDGQ